MDEYEIISKADFILYLKYLLNIVEDEKILENVKEVIEIEIDYTPSAYYYHEILDAFDILICKKCNISFIHWSKISSWKTFLRKNKIKKYL